MYQFKSLGIKTNFILDQLLAQTIERDDYFVIKTPERADYFWGNYILIKTMPIAYESSQLLRQCVDIFEKEVGKIDELGYCAITIDRDCNSDSEPLDLKAFKNYGFSISFDKIFIALQVRTPSKLNQRLSQKISISEYNLDINIERYIEIHMESSWEYGNKQEQYEFLKKQALDFSKIIKQGQAKRYGAFLDDKMVGDLGIYWNDLNTVRFNSVSTHHLYRRQGICSTLVYEVSKILLDNGQVKQLVMQADENYHAAHIYESIGFKPRERIISLEWKDKVRFSSQKF